MAILSLKGISVLTELRCEAIRDRVHISAIRMPLPEDQKEQEEEEEEEEEARQHTFLMSSELVSAFASMFPK